MIELKQHDTARPIIDTLLLNGLPIDLTDSEIVFVMRRRPVCGIPVGDPIRVEGVTIDAPPTDGKVRLLPTEDMMENTGVFDTEWEITFIDETVLTVPTRGYNVLRIVPDIG